jgi:glyoxylase-like metal-dependent hydrolase (beta-lactamase superfamily II)
MEHIVPLPIRFLYQGEFQEITPVLLRDAQEMILVDCGYPNFAQLLEEAMNRHEIALRSITKLIVTHHDIDHIGSLAAIKRSFPHIEILAPRGEIPYIDGREKPLRLEQAERSYDDLPEEAKPGAEQFMQYLKSVEPVSVDREISGGERLPWCGGIEVISTPGHTRDHISLYLPAYKTLIAGDAVYIDEGRLNIANPQYAYHLNEAVRSVQRLQAYDMERILCYHGGVFEGDCKKALQCLLQEYS